MEQYSGMLGMCTFLIHCKTCDMRSVLLFIENYFKIHWHLPPINTKNATIFVLFSGHPIFIMGINRNIIRLMRNHNPIREIFCESREL